MKIEKLLTFKSLVLLFTFLNVFANYSQTTYTVTSTSKDGAGSIMKQLH